MIVGDLVLVSVIISIALIFCDIVIFNVVVPTVIGVATLIGASLMAMGWIPATLTSLMTTDITMLSGFTVLMWKYGYLFDNKHLPVVCQGYLVLTSDLQKGATVKGMFSGVEWDLILEDDAECTVAKAGTKMVIIKSEVGLLTVRPTKE